MLKTKLKFNSAWLPRLSVVLLFIVFYFWSSGALASTNNLLAIINQAYSIILICTGAIFVYSFGGLDLSLGSVLAICNVVLTYMILAGVPFVIALIVALLLGAFSGFMGGFFSRKLHLPPFVVTLCISYIWTGISEYACKDGFMYLPTWFTSMVNRIGLKIFVLVLFILLSGYLFNYTRFGKYTKTIGGSEVVAKLNGINVDKYAILAHVLAGFCAAVASVFSLARSGICMPSAGAGLQLDVLVALVLGGVPITGGYRSRTEAIIFGSLIMALLTNGLVICGVNPYAVQGITGALFIIIVVPSFIRNREKVLV